LPLIHFFGLWIILYYEHRSITFLLFVNPNKVMISQWGQCFVNQMRRAFKTYS